MIGPWELRRRIKGRKERLVLLQYNQSSIRPRHNDKQHLMVMVTSLGNNKSQYRLFPSYNRHGRHGRVPLLERSTGRLP
jgi:hypothetical protein